MASCTYVVKTMRCWAGVAGVRTSSPFCQQHGAALDPEVCSFLPPLGQVNGAWYMVLEDLCRGAGPFPSVLDLKMGQVTSSPTARASKVQGEVAKYPHQAQVGFRVTGMKVRATGRTRRRD